MPSSYKELWCETLDEVVVDLYGPDVYYNELTDAQRRKATALTDERATDIWAGLIDDAVERARQY